MTNQAFVKRVVVLALAAVAVGCADGRGVLTRQIEARRLASELRVTFARANEAGSRAVLADSDEASSAAAAEARSAEEQASSALTALEPLLQTLGYRTELDSIAAFRRRFDEFRSLDEEILPLAAENTNLKAQRLSFGEASVQAERFVGALAARADAPAGVELEKAAARADVLEIQVLQARHIAESDEKVMAQIESRMETLSADARSRLTRLDAGSGRQADIATAREALDRFLTLNEQVIRLSRRNTNVRSLALTLGRKRVAAAECEDQLRVLEEALARHGTEATR